MDRNTASVYNYSKAAGLLSKAYVKDRAALLFECKSLDQLWTMLFNSPAPMMPEQLLAREIEQHAFEKFISQYTYFLNQFNKAPDILVDQFEIYEIENLKEICDAMIFGETECPELRKLTSYSKLKLDKWPDIAEITQGTPYEWIKKVPDISEKQQFEFMLDLNLIQNMWKAINKCHGEEKENLVKLFISEFEVKNIIWALRLVIYYKLPKEAVLDKLLYVTKKDSASDPLLRETLKVLEYDLTDYNDWKKFKYKDYLNPKIEGTPWMVDPSWLERKLRPVFIEKAFTIFHQSNMNSAALVAWFKIKSFELNCIRTAVESLRLKVKSEAAMETIGIKEQK